MKGNFANSQELVSVKEIRDDTLVLEDGGLRKIIMVGGVNFSLKSDKEQAIITSLYQNLLNALDFPIQIVIHSRKVNINRYLENLKERKDQEVSPLLKSQIDEYTAFVAKFVDQNAIMEKIFLVVIPWYPSTLKSAGGGILNLVPFLGKKQTEAKVGDKAQDKEKEKEGVDFAHEVSQLDQRVEQVVNGLSLMELDVILLGNEALAELLYNFYNPETTEREGLVIPEEDVSNT